MQRAQRVRVRVQRPDPRTMPIHDLERSIIRRKLAGEFAGTGPLPEGCTLEAHAVDPEAVGQLLAVWVRHVLARDPVSRAKFPSLADDE